VSFKLNPKRKKNWKYPLQLLGVKLGFQNVDFYYKHGDNELVIGEGCSTCDAIFNCSSGKIVVGKNTVFGHNVVLLTGTHLFYRGRRAKLAGAPYAETPKEGRDITIGEGCFIGSFALLIGPCILGDNVRVSAGSVVTGTIKEGTTVYGNTLVSNGYYIKEL